jgi:peptide/nickel transport system permease protein
MHPVLRTVIQRLGLGVITLFFVSCIIFFSMQFLPGDFATAILGQSATPETVKAFEHEVGLDKPALTRYVEWIEGVAHGDFGKSYSDYGSSSPRTVAQLIAPRLWNTLFLAAMAALIAVPLAVGLGLLAALYRNSFFDRAVNALTLTTISFPEFLVAYILMMFLAVKAFPGLGHPLFHSLSNVSPDTPFLERVYRCALPAFTLTLVIVAHMMRMTRAAVINLLASPYIEMAQLKGATRRDVILHHALPNAWAPIVNVIAFNLAYLIVGVVVVEVVFVYPGIGQLMVDSVTSRNIPVVQACALIFAATYILLNLFADVISIVTNPRLLHPR